MNSMFLTKIKSRIDPKKYFVRSKCQLTPLNFRSAQLSRFLRTLLPSQFTNFQFKITYYLSYLLMEEQEHWINTTKYGLCIKYIVKNNKIEMSWVSKTNNITPKCVIGTVPHELVREEAPEQVYRKVRKYRALHIDDSSMPPVIHIQLEADKADQLDVFFEDQTDQAGQAKYNKIFSKKMDKLINYGVKYGTIKTESQEVSVVYDPHNSQTLTLLILKGEQLRVGQSTFPRSSIPNTIKQPLLNLIKTLPELKVEKTEKPPHESLIIISGQQEEGEEKWPGKIALFKHIFLTELITHMIINQFGRRKQKKTKEREDFEQLQYEDEELEELRRSGHRLYEFRDHPIKRRRKKKRNKQEEEQDSLDEEEDEQMGMVEKIGEKIYEYYFPGSNADQAKETKEKKKEEICNFTFISGQEKSKINRMRYCLHQMTQETDHTQALMDFLYLVFEVEPEEGLVGKSAGKKAVKDNQSKEEPKKGVMREFMGRFKVKRSVGICLKEYSKESFFHKIINIGLRALCTPYQLMFLRLPFSHVFWSIRLLYHRHKRAIFHRKQKKNEGRTIKLYRGCQLTEKEIEALRGSVGGYIEAEGFLSTTLLNSMASAFAVNVLVEILVPVANLKGMGDNGFANICDFSDHSIEKEVLVNAFNVFKVLRIQKPASNPQENSDEQYYTLYLQYGSIKGVEQKVRKSEDLTEDEFKWKCDFYEIMSIKRCLEINEERMTKHWHTKLTKVLKEEERKVEVRKKSLKERIKKQYQEAVKKLGQWEKELIVNTQHQQQSISCMTNYAGLLYTLGQSRKACIYLRRRMKQAMQERRMQAPHWRKSQCGMYKENLCRLLLYKCYWNIGRVEQSYECMQELMQNYVSIQAHESDEKYYGLLHNMTSICADMVQMEDVREKHKAKLISILNKHSLTNTVVYRKLMDGEKRRKEMEEGEKKNERKKEKRKQKKKEKKSKAERKKQKEEKKKELADRKERLKEKKMELKYIRLYTFGLYSSQYLEKLWELISMPNTWGWWKQVVKQSKRYLIIRNSAPHVQNRRQTCIVLMRMLWACVQRKWKHELAMICEQVVSFTHPRIHNIKQFQLLRYCIEYCFILNFILSGL